MNRRVTIYTPPGYENTAQKYPVLFLLHGMRGDEEAWITLGRTAQILDNLVAQGKTKPMIVVMPNGNVSQEAAIQPDKDAKSAVYSNLELKLKTQFNKKPKLYWIAIGKSDFLYKTNEDYRKMLDEKGHQYIYFENEEGHIWKNWRIYLAKYASMLF